MHEEIRISSRQAILLVLYVHISTTVNFIPSSLLAFLTQDVWISIIPGAILAIMFAYYPIADLGMRFPGQSLVQLSEKLLGKVLGKLFGFIIVYSLFIYHCWSLREFGELMVAVTPEVPMWVYIVVLSLTTSYAVKSGLEVIGRCGEWLFPIGLLSLMLIGILNITNVELANLLPIVESKLSAMFGASLRNMDWIATSSLVFGLILPSVNKPKDLKKITIIGIGLGCVMLVSFSILNIAIFGPELVKINNFQMLTLAEYAKITDVFQRFEVFIIVMWVTWIFMRATICSYTAVLSLCHLLHFKDYRFLVFPETMLAIAYSIYIYDSFQEMSNLYTLDLYYLFYTAAIPCFLWIICVIRLKFGKLKPAKKPL